MLNRLKHEFTDPENQKDMERGIFFALIVSTVIAALFTTSDYLALNFDYVRGQTPYGVLWNLLNAHFWTDFSYRMYIMEFVLGQELMMWYFWVYQGMHWKGKIIHLNKFLFYAGWFQSIIWMRGSVFQNVTVTTFAPLGSIAPWIIIPFILLQKLPIGWSWNFSDAHSWCAFVGNAGVTSGDTVTFVNGQPLISCPGGWLRWNPAYSWFWSYAMIMFWLIVPTLFWLKPRWKAWNESRRNDEGEIEGYVLLRPICWVKGCNPYVFGRLFDGKVFWICSRCGGKCGHYYRVPDYPEGPCCEGGDMCDGSCMDDEDK